MDDRKKFTYRYDEGTEKLLNEGLVKCNLTSLNKLIDKLICDALVRYPNELKALENIVGDAKAQLKECSIEKERVETELKQLKGAIKQDFENRELIKKLIS